jgi:RNA polymerase sigma-70 factor (ECF subfamily)
MLCDLPEIDERGATIASFHESEAERVLVLAAKRGDARAFEILVRRHQRKILAIAMRFARNREDAEDIAQQSFQKAFVNMHRFRGKSRFSTWLTRIAINEALMWLSRRRASREVRIEESVTADETALPPDYPGSDPSPEDSCLQRERKRILAAAMNKLKPGMRTAIELRDLSELSTEETARVMQLSVEAVKARLFHARRKLRKSLESYVSRENGSFAMSAVKGG